MNLTIVRLKRTNWRLLEAGQELEAGEDIEADTWVTYKEAQEMALNGSMKENRIALVLLRWLSDRGVLL